MLTDIQIAQNAKMEKIVDIAKKLDIHEDGLELYGDYKAKVKPAVYESLQDGPDGKLVKYVPGAVSKGVLENYIDVARKIS